MTATRATASVGLALFRLVGVGGLFAWYFLLLLFLPLWGWPEPRRRRWQLACMHTWGRLVTRLCGYRVQVEGTPPAGCLLAPNHLGYADILVLAAATPCFFVAKAEVASWPVIGWGAVLYGHLFVSRKRGSRGLKELVAEIQRRLAAGHNVCVFLEGTSTGGDTVLPFHASFVQPAIDSGRPVVPVAIEWCPSDPAIDVAEDIAYWKDHAFVPHFWRQLGLRGKAVRISFGVPIASADTQRQALAQTAHTKVSELLGLSAG